MAVAMSKRSILASVWTGLLLVACLIPGRWLRVERSVIPPAIPHLDKLVHAGLFGVFGFLWMTSTPPRRRIAWLVGIGIALAVGTECAQGLSFIARDPDPLDALADAAGLFAGLLAAGALDRHQGPG